MHQSITMGHMAAGLLLGAALAQAQTYTQAFPGLTFNRPLWMEEVPGKPGNFLVMEQAITLSATMPPGMSGP
jgi:hypothetical protein